MIELERGKMTAKDMAWFQSLTVPQVARVVREHGLKTVVFAAGGTKRWFILNHLDRWPTDRSYWEEYLKYGGQRFLEITKLFFEHGVSTLLTHAVIPSQLDGQGNRYLPLALTSGMERIAASPEFLAFYDEYGVRVRFFGNYRRVLQELGYKDALELFDRVEEQTKENDQHVLFWGFNSEQDQMTPIFEQVVRYYQEHGVVPNKDQVVELYYGEPVSPVDIYITFNRLRTWVFPPLLDGHADLYFTVGLSFDFSSKQLKSILYDHLFARAGTHRDYSALSPDAFSEVQMFYRLNRDGVIGIGRCYEPGAFWHPVPQVHLLAGWDNQAG
ncbi:MAG: hypothetical protein JXA89_27725 [Anaerolineae bacterium]|nr:hypothetical protein [Anaerolineae bacterium]